MNIKAVIKLDLKAITVSRSRRSRDKRGIIVDGNRRAGADANEGTMTLLAPQSIKTMVISMDKQIEWTLIDVNTNANASGDESRAMTLFAPQNIKAYVVTK